MQLGSSIMQMYSDHPAFVLPLDDVAWRWSIRQKTPRAVDLDAEVVVTHGASKPQAINFSAEILGHSDGSRGIQSH